MSAPDRIYALVLGASLRSAHQTEAEAIKLRDIWAPQAHISGIPYECVTYVPESELRAARKRIEALEAEREHLQCVNCGWFV